MPRCHDVFCASAMEVTGVAGETRETRVTEASKIEEGGGGGGEDVTMAEQTMNKER